MKESNWRFLKKLLFNKDIYGLKIKRAPLSGAFLLAYYKFFLNESKLVVEIFSLVAILF